MDRTERGQRFLGLSAYLDQPFKFELSLPRNGEL
jgi:hypothetical protein